MASVCRSFTVKQAHPSFQLSLALKSGHGIPEGATQLTMRSNRLDWASFVSPEQPHSAANRHQGPQDDFRMNCHHEEASPLHHRFAAVMIHGDLNVSSVNRCSCRLAKAISPVIEPEGEEGPAQCCRVAGSEPSEEVSAFCTSQASGRPQRNLLFLTTRTL